MIFFKFALLAAALAAAWVYFIQPNIPLETCPFCEGRSAQVERAGARVMGMAGVQPEPPVKCAYCGNTGKMTPNEIKKYQPLLEELRKAKASTP